MCEKRENGRERWSEKERKGLLTSEWRGNDLGKEKLRDREREREGEREM